MFGQIATKQVFVIFFQSPIMTECPFTRIELGHVPCFEFKQFIYDAGNHIIS
ncbi:hypothetical protein VIBHAR_00013 [Vibrio campbellii ATCC BAA-1116]|uniref:Uncharacterized protein n=1 Tax=Vibrio campbellii (strain ATCC BAA-1116) TaxID=2902295 RepID=A7MSZ0_VIBC1|nr:hypothetical protein VIBHAR_00013 [Vibrio campbellii ATCC BAA-1116]